jgi:hypothetical protein
VLFVIVLVLLNYYAVRAVWRRRSRIVPLRGFGTAADLGRLRQDVPRVRVRDISVVGPDETRLTVGPVRDPQDPDLGLDDAETEYRIAMDERDPGFEILHDWLSDQTVLGIVLPPESRLIRLRSVDGLQPLTLRRLDV